MITNNEALAAVRERRRVPHSFEGDSILGIIDNAIIDQVNSGWLAINLDRFPEAKNMRTLRIIEDYYTDLGYLVSEGMIFWMYPSSK